VYYHLGLGCPLLLYFINSCFGIRSLPDYVFSLFLTVQFWDDKSSNNDI
jgi:hypothetical protein